MRLFCTRAPCQCPDDGEELKAIGQSIKRYYIALEIVSYWAKYQKMLKNKEFSYNHQAKSYLFVSFFYLYFFLTLSIK